jgi:hypothetical protein
MPNVQLAAGTTSPLQVEPVIANSAGLLLVTEEIVTGVPPVLVSATSRGALGRSIVCVPNVMEGGTLKAPGGTVTTSKGLVVQTPMPVNSSLMLVPVCASE